MRICSESLCDNKHFGKGLCNTHYKQVRKYGNISYIDRRTLDKMPYSIELRQKVIKDYLEYKGIKYITNKHSISKEAVYSILKRSGNRIRTKSESKEGALNHNWSESPSYGAIHAWVRNKKPSTGRCEKCNNIKKLDLANVSDTYNTETYIRDINMWNWLCRKCHMIQDGRLGRMYHGGMKAIYTACTISGCDNKHEARGLCNKHYQRIRYWIKTGRAADYGDTIHL